MKGRPKNVPCETVTIIQWRDAEVATPEEGSNVIVQIIGNPSDEDIKKSYRIAWYHNGEYWNTHKFPMSIYLPYKWAYFL